MPLFSDVIIVGKMRYGSKLNICNLGKMRVLKVKFKIGVG
jgi:hypothetical protein